MLTKPHTDPLLQNASLGYIRNTRRVLFWLILADLCSFLVKIKPSNWYDKISRSLTRQKKKYKIKDLSLLLFASSCFPSPISYFTLVKWSPISLWGGKEAWSGPTWNIPILDMYGTVTYVQLWGKKLLSCGSTLKACRSRPFSHCERLILRMDLANGKCSINSSAGKTWMHWLLSEECWQTRSAKYLF